MKYISRLHLSLLAKFSLISFLITAGIAIALAWGIQYELEQNALRQEAESAADQVVTILNPNLETADLTGPLGETRYAQIDALIRQNVIHQHIVRVKIWNRDGLLLYSDERDLVGQRFPLSDELKEALNGEVATDVSSLTKAENVGERASFQRLLEIYVPLHPMGSPDVKGAYEIYHDLAVVEPRIAEMRRFTWLSVGLGFLILYGSSFTLVRGASRELIRRNQENARLYEEAKQRLVERQQAEAELQRHAHELELLNDMGRSIAASLDLREIASRVVAQCAERFDGFLCGLLLYDEARAELVAYAAAGQGAHLIPPGERTPLGHGLIGHAALTRRTQFADHTATSAHFVPLSGLPIRAELAIPILREEKLLGVLVVGSDHAGAFRPDDVLLLETLAAQLAPAVENAQLFRDLGASYDHTLDALAAALDARDKETEGHSRRVVAFTLALARRMNLPEEELATIQRGALLHDIGKIGVPDAILLKPGPLTDEERAIMRNHPEWGRRILSGIPFLAGAAEIVRAHQERWDGAGYPQGRKGEAIPLGARIFAVADTFDAITSDRPYRAGRSYAVARAEIEAGRGTQFDPRFVDAFRQIPEDEWSRLRAEAISTPIAAGPLPLWAEPPAASPELEELHRLIADRLTGAHNRSYLEEFVARELQRSARYGHGISLVLLDVDDFKAYNEAHGPAAGDEALRRLVRQLRRNVRSADVIARYAEDEFAVVLPETDAEGARLAGEKFRIAIEGHAFPHGGLTVSLGVANCAIAGGMSTDVLIAMADQALADAKRRGRNGVSVWGPEMAELPKPTEGAVPAAVE